MTRLKTMEGVQPFFNLFLFLSFSFTSNENEKTEYKWRSPITKHSETVFAIVWRWPRNWYSYIALHGETFCFVKFKRKYYPNYIVVQCTEHVIFRVIRGHLSMLGHGGTRAMWLSPPVSPNMKNILDSCQIVKQIYHLYNPYQTGAQP